MYSRAIRHPFIFNYDDDTYVLNNQHVQQGLTWQTFAWSWTSTEFSNWHPLTWLSHAFDCQLYGLDPAGHHFTSVLFHALNVVLLFLLLRRATAATGRSLLVAALFAVHPLNVQSVAWVAERKSVLSTFFFLLTIGAYGWYALQPTLKRYLTMALLAVLALAAKPMVITLPCVLLLLDFWPLQRIAGLRLSSERFASQRSGEDSSPESYSEHPDTALAVSPSRVPRLVFEKLPLLVLSAGSGVITIVASRLYGSMRFKLPLGLRIENAIYCYAIYIWKAFWPAHLAVFYPHPGATLSAWRVGSAALLLIVLTAVAWLQRSVRPYLLTGWLWFLGTMVPAIGLIQVGEQGMADRYAYIPLIGIFLMVVWAAAEFADRKPFTLPAQATSGAIVVIFLSIASWRQLGYWQSAYDLWLRAVQVTNDNFMADDNLAAALLQLGRPEEAIPYLQNALRLRPDDPSIHLNLAGALAMSDSKREAIAEYEIAIPKLNDPSMAVSAYDTLGRLYAGIGNYEKARESYQQALRINPQQERAKSGLAQVEFSDALRNAAESPSGPHYLRLGQLLQAQGHLDQAEAAYQQALRLDPKLQDARTALEALKKNH